jgi:hypothetical protein
MAGSAFTLLDGNQFAKTLVPSLTGVADSLRDLFTQFGMRPYVVKLVRTRWTGPRRGLGEEILVSETVLLPTPNVSDLTAMMASVQAMGRVEQGTLTVSEIPSRYTEEQLRGLTSTGEQPEPNEHFFWEIRLLNMDGTQGQYRRFQLLATPFFDIENLQWIVQLEKCAEDRTRSGELR